jgi:hypothetical protein
LSSALCSRFTQTHIEEAIILCKESLFSLSSLHPDRQYSYFKLQEAYRRLTRQWETVVTEIRHLRSFSRFPLPLLYKDLQAAARWGPVTIKWIFVQRHHHSNVRDPHHVPLPSITLAELTNLKDRFARAVRHASIMDLKVPRNDLITLLFNCSFHVYSSPRSSSL